jgi:hypothetical protein
MANYELPNNVVRSIPIVSKDAAGDVVPAPPNVVYTAVSDNPGINAAINASTLVLNATVRTVANVNITVDDDGPLSAFVLVVDVVDNVTPTSVALDTVNVTDTPQPIPGAAPPGP